jgi:hypothetical protein
LDRLRGPPARSRFLVVAARIVNEHATTFIGHRSLLAPGAP